MSQFHTTRYNSPKALRTSKQELEAPVVILTGTRMTLTASDQMHTGPAGQSHMIFDVTRNFTAICRPNHVCVYSISKETNPWELAAANVHDRRLRYCFSCL
jgi:hypothetical protein